MAVPGSLAAPSGPALVPPASDPAGIAAAPPGRDPRLLYLASLSTEKSRRSMRAALASIAGEFGQSPELLPWHLLRYEHTSALRGRLAQRYAPATVNRFLAALRSVLREARRLELISAEDAARAGDVPRVKGTRLPKGRALAAREIKALLAACNLATNAGARDAALVSILYGGGLRRAEVVDLDLADHDPEASSLRVRGKGNKERISYVAAGKNALAGWLARRGAEPGPLFLPIDRFDRITPRRMSDQSIRDILKRLADRAGVAAFSPHDCRRTFVSDLLEAGADIATVQALAGHASVVTTQRYDRRGEETKRRAAGLIRM